MKERTVAGGYYGSRDRAAFALNETRLISVADGVQHGVETWLQKSARVHYDVRHVLRVSDLLHKNPVQHHRSPAVCAADERCCIVLVAGQPAKHEKRRQPNTECGRVNIKQTPNTVCHHSAEKQTWENTKGREKQKDW